MGGDMPEGWRAATLGDIGRLHCGQSPSSRAVNRLGQGVPYVSGPEQWSSGQLVIDKWTTAPRKLVPIGCVFVTVKGAGVGKTVAGGPAVIGRDIYAFEPGPGLDRRFIHLAIDFDIQALISRAAGLIPGLKRTDILSQVVAVPPLEEQKRIVEKVDALLAQVNAARERLARVREILRRFRQSVLAAACSGRLTEEWRARHAPDAVSLDSVKSTRRTAWIRSEALRRARENRAANTSELLKRYVEPADPDTTADAPESWVWTTLDHITLLSGGVTKGQKRGAGTRLRTVPYLRVANVQRGHLDLAVVKQIEATDAEIADLQLKPGDVLLNEGGDIDKLGRGWVWEGQIPTCIHQNHVFRARPLPGLVNPFFVSHYANAVGQDFFFSAGAQTVNLASVSLSKVRSLPVPLPPPTEQNEIVRRIHGLFTVADAIERRLALAVASAEKLPQAVLAKAFRGELVSADPP